MRTFFAIAEEEVGAAAGAEAVDGNAWFTKAGFEKLGAVGVAKIEEDFLWRRLMARRGHVEPLQRIGFVAGAEFVEEVCRVRELRGELGGNFSADFVAATADGGSDGSQNISRLRVELHLHLADGLGNDALERASPAGVDGGHSAIFRVNQKDRHTIGGLYGEEKTRAIGDGGVATARSRGSRIEAQNGVGMELQQGDEIGVACAKSGLEAAAIFADIVTGVPFRKT